MPTQPDRALLKQAARQHGVITRAQARAAGLSDHQIDHRITRGQLLPARRGVYVLAGTERTWIQELTVAWLWVGRGAIISHRAAARCWDLDGCTDSAFELSVPRGVFARGSDVKVHRTQFLKPSDIAWHKGLRITTPTRTLIDLGAAVDKATVELALEDALRRQLTTLERLRRRLTELDGSGRPGSRTIRSLLDERDPLAAPTASSLETKVWRFLNERKLPRPKRQFEVRKNGYVVGRPDFAYPERRFAIEAHSYRYHSGRADWENDVQRDRKLRRLGWKILYVTSRDLAERPDEIEEEIRRALEM